MPHEVGDLSITQFNYYRKHAITKDYLEAAGDGIELDKYKEFLYQSPDDDSIKMKKHKLMMQAKQNVIDSGEKVTLEALNKEKERLFRENGID